MCLDGHSSPSGCYHMCGPYDQEGPDSMMTDNSGSFFCDGEQHHLFPGIDLNCIEACDNACPDDCCDDASCCAEEECVASCDLLCDGYLGCDHPPQCPSPECADTHCDLPDCDGDSPPCFDEACLSTLDYDHDMGTARKKRKASHVYTANDHDHGHNIFSPASQQLAYQTNSHNPACFGHTDHCPEGCINPTHLTLQPTLCQHISLPYFAHPPHPTAITSNNAFDGFRPSHSSSDRDASTASLASTPYLTHTESRPSTSCSIPMDYHDPSLHDKPIVCRCVNEDGQRCDYAFADAGSLNQHILDTHISKTCRGDDDSEGFYCCWADCARHLNNQPFSSIGKIESHYLSHSGHKGWRCNICGNIYAREGSLDRHRQTHLNDKIYRCHICGKTTTDKNQLKIHVRSHTGEKPYKCDFPGCNHRASDSTNMTKHKKTHQPRTNFCPYPGCNRLFVRSDGLKRHMKTCKARKDFENSVDLSHVDVQSAALG